jgi:large subunit ribosomal protein L32
MPVPKKKSTRTRRDKRRTNWKLAAPSMSTCSHCGSIKEPHKICSVCGYYGGVEVLSPDKL